MKRVKATNQGFVEKKIGRKIVSPNMIEAGGWTHGGDCTRRNRLIM